MINSLKKLLCHAMVNKKTIFVKDNTGNCRIFRVSAQEFFVSPLVLGSYIVCK